MPIEWSGFISVYCKLTAACRIKFSEMLFSVKRINFVVLSFSTGFGDQLSPTLPPPCFYVKFAIFSRFK